MARLLNEDGPGRDDICSDLPDCDQSGSGFRSGHDDRRPRRRRAIRVGRIEVDCTPVTFRTPGQAMNVVSCPVTQTVMAPVTQTTNVTSVGPCGCAQTTPTTQTFPFPVDLTVNVPPIIM